MSARARAVVALTFVLLALPQQSITPEPPRPALAAPAVAAGRGTPVKSVVAASSSAYRAGGHFVQMNELGGPVFWGYCGGVVAVNTASMTRADQAVVEGAAREFTATVAGHWTVTTTTRAEGAGTTVVVKMDHVPDSGSWGITYDSLVQAGASTSITDTTVHLSTDLSGLSADLHTVTIHELGHAVGADHSPSAVDVMFADMAQPWTTYTAVEAAGIRKVSGRACG